MGGTPGVRFLGTRTLRWADRRLDEPRPVVLADVPRRTRAAQKSKRAARAEAGSRRTCRWASAGSRRGRAANRAVTPPHCPRGHHQARSTCNLRVRRRHSGMPPGNRSLALLGLSYLLGIVVGSARSPGGMSWAAGACSGCRYLRRGREHRAGLRGCPHLAPSGVARGGLYSI